MSDGASSTVDIYFSDVFGVTPRILERYGAFNVSLVNDLPLFIDPFLLFNSRKPKYRKLHDEIIEYLSFLRDQSAAGTIGDGLLRACTPSRKSTRIGSVFLEREIAAAVSGSISPAR